MIKQLSKVVSSKPGVAITKDALQDAADIASKKYVSTNANVPANLVNVKVTHPFTGASTTLTKPASATTAALVKAWLEGALREIGFGMGGDYGETAIPDIVVVTGSLTIYGQAVITFANFGASDVAPTVYATRVGQSVYRTTLGHVDNPGVMIDGVAYTTMIDITLGTTTGAQLKTAIETGIAAAIPSKVYKVECTYNTETSLFTVDFYALKHVECKLNAVEAVFVTTVADFV